MEEKIGNRKTRKIKKRVVSVLRANAFYDIIMYIYIGCSSVYIFILYVLLFG